MGTTYGDQPVDYFERIARALERIADVLDPERSL